MLKARSVRFFKTVACAICCVAAVGTAWADEVKIGAEAAAIENIFKKIQGPMEQASGDKLTLIFNGPAQAFKDLDKDVVDAAIGGITFPDWIRLMEKEGYPVPNKALYKARVIGKDVVRVLTNKDVTVTELSKEQLTAIFSGKIKNWSEVGGPQLPVKVVLGSKIPGTQAVFQKIIMDGGEYSKEVIEGTDAADVKSRVIATSGAVSLGALAQVDDTVNAPKIPVVGRPITMIVKRDMSPGLQRMVDYIRGPGQELIVK